MSTRALNMKLMSTRHALNLNRTQILKGLEWNGSIFGVVGALMLAVNTSYSGYGWMAFLASNLCWISYATITQIRGMLIMQVIFTMTSVVGMVRWLT